MVRKSFAIVTAAAALSLVLAGCTSTATTENTTKVKQGECSNAFTAPTPALNAVTVTGAVGTEPKIDTPTSLSVTKAETKVLEHGSGPFITDTSQLAQLTAYVSATTMKGKVFYPPAQLSQTPQSVAGWAELLPGLPEALLCAREGDRVAVALNTKHVAEGVAKQFALGENDGVVVVVDVKSVIRPTADGADVFNADMGMPSVIRDTNGRPGVVVPTGHAPKEARSQTLLRGDGAVVGADSVVYTHMLAVGWKSKTAIENTWDTKVPRAIAVSAFPPTVAKALTGTHVGSELQIVVPISELSADEAQALAQPGETAIVFVLDIVGLAR